MDYYFERKFDKRLIVSIVAVGILVFCGVMVETAMNVALPTLMEEFGVSTSVVQWITTGYLLVLSMIIPISSFLKKKWKLKQLFFVAILLFLAGVFLAIFAPSFGVLLLGRLIQGVGTGIALPLMFNVVLEQAPFEHMGFLMGIATIMIACAPAVGPVFGGWIIYHFSWRMLFVVLVPLLVISLVMGLIFLRQSCALEQVQFDGFGYVSLALCFVFLLLGINFTGVYGWGSLRVIGLLILAVIMLLLFLRREKHASCPMINLQIFKTGSFNFSLVTIFCMQFIILAFGFLIPNFSQLVIGANSQTSGLILFPGFLCGIFLTPAFGKLYDKFGAKRIILPGAYFVLAAGILYAATLPLKSVLIMTLLYPLFMFGQCHLLSNSMTLGLNQLPEHLNGDGNAVINALQQLAGAIGTAVVSSVVSMGQAQYPKDLVQGSYVGDTHAFWVIPVVMCVIIVSTTMSVKLKKREER